MDWSSISEIAFFAQFLLKNLDLEHKISHQKHIDL